MTMPNNLGEILLIEDDQADVELVKEVLQAERPDIIISACMHGNDLLVQLKERLESKKPLPKLILLDLNLPGKNGFEVLQEIKADKDLRHLPIIVMTSSQNPKDIRRTYELFGNSYVHKSITFDQFRTHLLNLSHFWLESALLPG